MILINIVETFYNNIRVKLSFGSIISFFLFTFPHKQTAKNNSFSISFPLIFLSSKQTYEKYKFTQFLSTQLLFSQLPSFHFLLSIHTKLESSDIFLFSFFIDTLDIHTYRREKKIIKENKYWHQKIVKCP